jgi:hypothetical protein
MKQTIKNPTLQRSPREFCFASIDFFQFAVEIRNKMIKPALWNYLIIFLLLPLLALSPPPVKERSAFLFAYYSGDGGSGLHLALSENGWKYQILKKGKSFLKPGLGNYVLLDPHLMQTPDGIFHLVWATGKARKELGYAWSKNLIDWSPQSLIKVMEKDSLVLNVSGPELHYDAASQKFILLWASTVPGKFPETDNSRDSLPGGYRLNHRIYRKTSSDLVNWSASEIWYEPGYSVSDPTLALDSGRCYLLFKDATNLGSNFQHNVKLVQGYAPGGTFPVEKPILVSKRSHAEAPTALRIDSQFVVFYHRYKSGKTGASFTKDFKKWKDVSDSISFPRGAKHGCILKIPQKLADKLRHQD